MTTEGIYVKKRILKAKIQSILFYFFRIFKIRNNKIVFTCIEGTTGYSCNPKYIAEELLTRNKDYELVWLVNEMSKMFPKGIKVKHNTLLNRAYQLSTAHIWIDNSRKQLEVRKRKKQVYLQTWHAKLGFKPTCLDRGASFSKIAFLVSKHDSDMVDYWLSNSMWYNETLKTGSLYEGKVLEIGSPRCDILVNASRSGHIKNDVKTDLCRRLGIEYVDISEVHFLMYAPTFRGGSQETNRTIEVGNHLPDFSILQITMEKRFGGKWILLLRLHPQIVARHLNDLQNVKNIVDVSLQDDMYEILAGCDAFLTDYSSAAFDAAIMRIPVFLYADDYIEYERERGKLLWDLKSDKFPFPFAINNDELESCILNFDEKEYQRKLGELFFEASVKEDGDSASKVADFIDNVIGGSV